MNNFLLAGLLIVISLMITFSMYFLNSENIRIYEQNSDDTILPENVTKTLIETGRSIGDLPLLEP